jgi:hypothetical protein
MPIKWSAGYNAAGYLPEMEPAEFANFGEAVQFLVEELELEAERQSEADNEAAADACEALSWALANDAAPNHEWSGTAAGFEYWIKESPHA